MAIVMVGGCDTEGNGCAGDRLGESQWVRYEAGERKRREIVRTKKRDGKHKMLETWMEETER